ncbi:PREDICTED: uncharacterized protein LOC108567303 [Nicrophorus vespilloides]|uniref:Uncharacterized protein LOC108567303 n=1 Tax=Nicrophorus vespilloides TaxID=110193 RepID=A0ABM1N8L5_NICVS|nr:PREDICTED: uncharacterized protein LOC108567303 [Nicrophorus vespilloides]
MFKQLFLVVALCASLSLAYQADLEPVFDRYGQEFYLIPAQEYRIARHRRASDHNLKHKTWGYNDEKKGDVIGLEGKYTHRPTDSQLGVHAEKTQRGNSHAQVSGKTQFENDDGDARWSVGGNVNKQWNQRGQSHTGYGWEVEGDWDF